MRKTKVFALILSVVMLIMTFAPIAGAFSDVPAENAVLSEAIDTLLAKKITKGISENEFGTEQNVTREQMAAFIYRMLNDGESPEGGENKTNFTDLDDPTFYTMISWASEEGIIKGISETEFNPKGNITLQDCYTMLVRALGFGEDGTLSYPDGYISAAEEKGLSKNVSEEIENGAYLTRGDVAIILYNALSSLNDHVLDGKKIIFIGNSFTYYGRTVFDGYNNVTEQVMLRRFGDEGYFYQMCKQNGADVDVTNWTWGGHTLGDTFGGSCSADRGHDGHDHLADLKKYSDMNYDYVIIQPGSADTTETAKEGIKLIMDIFKEANPDAEFIYLMHPRYYLRGKDSDKDLIANLDNIVEEFDLTLVNWGILVSDMISGEAKVENATEEYSKNTFIVTKSAADGYHPSLLSGYITTQMVYSALSGEKAQGEDYSFCTDATIDERFSVEAFLNSYYTYDNISPADAETKLSGDDLTTFPEIFNSPADMKGIQKIIDSYMN